MSDLDLSATDSPDQRSWMLQGPIDCGEMIDLGSFRSLMNDAIDAQTKRGGSSSGLHKMADLTITVVATFTAEEGVVAAERAFDIEQTDNKTIMRPHSVSAKQIRARKDRRAIERLMEQELRR